MNEFLERPQHGHGALDQSGKAPCRQWTGGNAAREHRHVVAQDHLERGDHEQQARDDRDTRRTSYHSEQQHDEAEGALVHAAHQPTQGKVVCRRLVVQSLQQDRGGDKRCAIRG
jgi:hypothetical protein